MGRLFHEVAGEGLGPLGVRPEQFPILVELWFGEGASRSGLAASQEMDANDVDALVASLVADRLIEPIRHASTENLVLTDKGKAVRDDAVKAARRANQAAAGALSEADMAQLLGLMNRVIDALQAAKTR